MTDLEPELPARVVAKRVCAQGVVAIELVTLDGRALPPWDSGAHIDIEIDGLHPRQYSLCGDRHDTSRYRIGVLRAQDSRGTSRHLHDTLAVGDEVRLRGPRNHFRLESSPRYVFIAGGIGITPILAMIEQVERAGADWRLVYGGRRRVSMAFLDELDRYGERVWVRPQDEVGLLDLDAILSASGPDTVVYCCGPEPLLAAVEHLCRDRPQYTVHVERFAPREVPAPARGTSIEVVLDKTGSTLMVGPDQTILEAVRQAGVPADFSCEEGTCGTCETRIINGLADHRDSVLEDDERASGETMMICVSRALTPRLILDL